MVMAHVDASVSLPRPGLRSAAAAARAEVSGIASPTRVSSQVCDPSVATGDDRAPFQQVIRVSQGESYESLMRLPRAVFAEKLKRWDICRCARLLQIRASFSERFAG